MTEYDLRARLTPVTAGRHVAVILTPEADQEGCQGTPVQNSQAVDGRIHKKGFVNLSGFGIEVAKAPLISILHRFTRPGREERHEKTTAVS
jgi:hypothetical protein